MKSMILVETVVKISQMKNTTIIFIIIIIIKIGFINEFQCLKYLFLKISNSMIKFTLQISLCFRSNLKPNLNHTV